MIIKSRAPVRIDFAGGWTDVSLFTQDAGGVVVNAAINHYVTGQLEVDEEEEPHLSESVGIRVTYQSELPSGSGLGTSAALNVVWLSLVKSRIAESKDRSRIAELAYQLEGILGILGGKQDQYASAHGGFNYLTFGSEVTVERLAIDPTMIGSLEERLVLCYTGKPRLSGDIHDDVWGAFQRGAHKTVNALYSLKQCAEQMRSALLDRDIDQFASLLSENWRHQKALDPSVTNPQMESLFEVASSAGAIGGKACGAGGGGCLLFCAAEGRKDELNEMLTDSGVRLIPFQFDFEGLVVTKE